MDNNYKTVSFINAVKKVKKEGNNKRCIVNIAEELEKRKGM